MRPGSSEDLRERRRAWARRRLSCCLLAGLLLALLLPGQALAHAVLTHSTPHASSTVETSPPAIQFDFNEPVETTSGAIRLFDQGGDELSVGEPFAPDGQAESVAVDIPDQLTDGVYTATYRVISADGHPVSGGFSFGVGVPVRTEGRTAPAVADLLDRDDSDPPSLEIAYGFARGLQYLALLLLVGALFFRVLVWRDGDRRAWPTQTLFAAAGIGVVASAAGLLLQSALVAGGGLGDIFDVNAIQDGLDTKTGEVWAARLGLWAGLLALLSWDGLPSRARSLVVAAATAGLVATAPLGGHATTHSPEAVLVIADVVHVVAAGAWLGALVLLLVVYWPRGNASSAAEGGLAATRRFSRMALPAILLLLAAGLLQSWFYLDQSPGELFGSSYGLLLVAKLILLGVIVALAAGSRRRLAGKAPSNSLLRRSMVAEVAVAIVILGVTAALVRSAPPASAGGPETRELDIGEMRVEMIIEPATTGPNDYHFYLFDRETGAQIRRVKDLTVRLTQPEEGIGPITLEVPYKSPAHYELLGPALGVPGTWDVAVDVRLSRFDLETARTEIEVRKP